MGIFNWFKKDDQKNRGLNNEFQKDLTVWRKLVVRSMQSNKKF